MPSDSPYGQALDVIDAQAQILRQSQKVAAQALEQVAKGLEREGIATNVAGQPGRDLPTLMAALPAERSRETASHCRLSEIGIDPAQILELSQGERTRVVVVAKMWAEAATRWGSERPLSKGPFAGTEPGARFRWESSVPPNTLGKVLDGIDRQFRFMDHSIRTATGQDTPADVKQQMNRLNEAIKVKVTNACPTNGRLTQDFWTRVNKISIEAGEAAGIHLVQIGPVAASIEATETVLHTRAAIEATTRQWGELPVSTKAGLQECFGIEELPTDARQLAEQLRPVVEAAAGVRLQLVGVAPIAGQGLL